VKVLFDTHAFFWAVSSDRRLSPSARDVFVRPENEVVLSVASIWEILLKAATGRFPFPQPAGAFIRSAMSKTSVTVLPILLQHVLRVEQLPPHHRDPFDRIILAQAIEEQIPIVSVDEKLRQYPVQVLW
jgi:PIN domain nuclease of toxin-antitoxin system